ncbi:hypothetical protein O9929_24905 [Vibrio lentus]|nr:hypothetical protein [Vibrio lentus]
MLSRQINAGRPCLNVCSLVLKQGGGNTARWYQAFNRGLESVTNKYGQITRLPCEKGVLLFTFFVVALAILAYFAKTTSTAFVPQEDKRYLVG